jgi:uncharacterized SAM-binding protein YcdF (DUF218 family)
MSFLLGKLVARLVSPLGVTLALAALGLALLAVRRTRLAAVLVASAGLVLWSFATPAVSDRLAAALERHAPPTPLDTLPHADAILVLGGAMKPALPPREFPEVGDSADRVLHAARLFHAGKAPVVVASGGRLPWQTRGASEAASTSVLLESLGVPRAAIVLEDASADTHQNCVRSRELLARLEVRTVLLVTSAIHMRRALATCRSAGLDATPAPTDYWVDDQDLSALDFTPSIEALLVSHLAVHEMLGIAGYRMRGWLRE